MAYQEGLSNQDEQETSQADNFSERIETLQKILSVEQARLVSYDEAAEIGEALISFYEVLAETTNNDEDADIESIDSSLMVGAV